MQDRPDSTKPENVGYSLGKILVFMTCAAMILQSALDKLQLPLATDEFENEPHLDLAHMRSEEYCNRPGSGEEIHGLEGVHPVSSMKLLGAVLLIRHGDRLPISRPPVALQNLVKRNSCFLGHHAQPSTPLLYQFIETITKYENAIKTMITPSLRDYALLPDTCSDISITQSGIVQMLNLGKYLGDRYMTKEMGSGQDIVLSTSRFDRTYQCLLSFLYGFAQDDFLKLLSNGIDSSSSIYFCDGDKSDSPAFGSSCECPHAINIPNLRRSLRYWNVTKPSIKFLYQLLELEDHRESDKPAISPSRVWDWLVSDYYCSGRNPPCFPNADGELNECLNASVIADLIELVEENQKQMIVNPEYIKGASLVVYPLLSSINRKFQELLKAFRQITEIQTKQPYLWVVSSHDVTMGPLFTALQKLSLRKVPYATRLVFELWADESSGHGSSSSEAKSQIRILLNGEDISKQTSICRHCDESGLCTLDCFSSFLNVTFFKNINEVDFRTACNSYP